MNSHDHINHLQNITGGLVLVAEHKKPCVTQLRFYDEVMAAKQPFNLAYFINCVFTDSILEEKHRYAEYSLVRGCRHDITIDLEKKKKQPNGRYTKDHNITPQEQANLIAALKSLDFVHWAGPTRHGVHCGIYFSDWMKVGHSRSVIGWFQQQLRKVAGYHGPLEVDVSPSVNCNRPSRFLEKFNFFRPAPPWDPAPALIAAQKPASGGISFSEDTSEGTARRLALRARANLEDICDAAQAAGKPVQWVRDLWQDVQQTAFNPFNEDVGRIVGPKTMVGETKLLKSGKFPLFLNASWSWNVCWEQKLGLATAIQHVFSDLQYEELLLLIEQAYLEASQKNLTKPDWSCWQDWVVQDIGRCWRKFSRGFPVKPFKKRAIREAIISTCIHCNRDKIQVSEIKRKSGISRDTISRAVAQWGLISQGIGKGAWVQVPSDWLPIPPDLKSPMHHPPTPAIATSSNIPSTPKRVPVPLRELTFEAFWRSLLPKPANLPVNPCPVELMALPEIKGALEPHYKLNSDWRQLTYRTADELEWGHNYRDDLMDVVRRCLSWNGDIVHETAFTMEILTVILGPMAGPYFIWLLNENFVLKVGGLVGSEEFLVAWGDNLLGEARFAWRFIEHCRRGGRFELIYGEPGTGKTEQLAERLAAAKGRAAGGSAQNDSAELLTKRIEKFLGTQKIQTIYKGYDFKPHDQRKQFPVIKRKLFFIDEFGQVSCDAAGIMALRWKPGSTVLAALGVKQNLPVGPGRVGEDLLEWLNHNPAALPTCKPLPLIENRRSENPNSCGIVKFFQAVGRGDIPEAGPGMDIIFCEEPSDILKKVISTAIQLQAKCILPTRNTAWQTTEGIVALERYNYELDFSDTRYQAKEMLVLINASLHARNHGLRNGMEVEVAENVRDDGPNGKVVVFVNKEHRLELELIEVSRKQARTGHGVQGAEYSVVVVGVIPSRATNRRWLYTSSSRAREHCVVICTREGLLDCIATDPSRKTLLPTLLDRAFEAFKSLPEPVVIKGKPRKRKKKMPIVENILP